MKPTQQPCMTCVHFRRGKSADPGGWCNSIEGYVHGSWTGCVRHRISPVTNRACDRDAKAKRSADTGA